ncbi:uncharacterized protein EV422DRAFT_33882 [Fimicolochytrium jonesii]|uniref:uncharacterized protein n=1 Tax=Fimicolochytrium jonesii TaxID=1396493 RepID=UPI0022FE0B57|nr:uncharacterized protein EV422DRAFT_33882 [Fimicolochytrium jonesii]KAI8827265.1 hypothetical protein EV422DRAFT_33882 [Fimicolochytrium jonesii]
MDAALLAIIGAQAGASGDNTPTAGSKAATPVGTAPGSPNPAPAAVSSEPAAVTSTPAPSSTPASVAASTRKQASETATRSAPRRSTRRAPRLESESEGAGSDDEDELSDDEEWADVKTWDPDTLIGDAADEQRLNAMSELHRESLIAERRGRLEKMKERLEVKKMVRRKFGATKPKRQNEDEDERPAKRQTKEKTKRDETMASFKREREKHSRAAKDGNAMQIDSVHDDHYESDDRLDADTEVRRKEISKATKSIPTYEQVLSIQVTRAQLTDWVFAPFFDKTVKGCFVRYGIGADAKDPKKNVYRLCLIDAVTTASRPYSIDDKPVPKSAIMNHAGAQRENTFSKVSNSPVTESEYRRWSETMVFNKIPFPAHHVKNKRDDLDRAKNYVFSSDEVSQMVTSRKALQKAPVNAAVELPALKRQLMYAEEQGNVEEQEQLRAQMDRILLNLSNKKEEETGARALSRSGSDLRIPGTPGNGAAPNLASSGFTAPRVTGVGGLAMADISNEMDGAFARDPVLEEIRL